MALNSEIDGIVTWRPDGSRGIAERLEAVAAEAAPAAPSTLHPRVPLIAPVENEQPPSTSPEKPARARGRRGWLVPVASGAAALVASATLSGLLWSTTTQRDNARQQLAATHATLTSTQKQLRTVQADAATRKVTADYVTLYIVDSGRVQTDYENAIACKSYSECRTAVQQALSDMQAFQSHRAAATVPSALANADGMLADGLSAAIAAAQELITGMDSDDLTKIEDGGHKFDAAMLSISKAETALGAGLR